MELAKRSVLSLWRLQVSELRGYEGFCEECECQTEVFHSAYLGIEVCAECKKKLLNKQPVLTKIKKAL